METSVHQRRWLVFGDALDTTSTQLLLRQADAADQWHDARRHLKRKVAGSIPALAIRIHACQRIFR